MVESEGEAPVRLGCALEAFLEKDEVLRIIHALKSNDLSEAAAEVAHERFLLIFDQYQEQPFLLDPSLDLLLEKLIFYVRQREKYNEKVIQQVFKYLYIITKVRGHKTVIKHLPHEVSDLEQVLSYLDEQDPNDPSKWEMRYFLLLWLSIIVLIPFDISRFDHDATQAGKSTIIRLIEVTKVYLCVGDKCRDAAALISSKLLSRPDLKHVNLPQFIDWCLQKIVLNKEQSNIVLSQTGTLSALAQLFKHGKRDDLLEYSDSVLAAIIKVDLHKQKMTAIRKLAFKLIQRIGMTFLKVKIASWRYSRGSRSLIVNLTGGTKASQPNNANGVHDDDDDEEIPDQIEDVIEILVCGLKDTDTIIRWSAAKGIGRITAKLPKDYADQVIESILQSFTLQESDSSWHGGCLSLAELGRRGLLLPSRLPEVVPVILKALVYDEQRGNFSVGSHIRDAACYVCWSFARAYEPDELKPFVQTIAGALLVVSIFDREVNCRRAASAAFQENVGRQGTFPHGIDILTTVDYFAVGNRPNSYLKLSEFIAQYDEYKVPLIDHLVKLKVNHWDKEIRELSGFALAALTPSKPEYIISHVIPDLVALATGFDLFTRHGAIIALARIIHTLYSELNLVLDEKVCNDIESIPKLLNDRKMFRGMGGELIRLAVCNFIEMLSKSALTITKESENLWLEILDDNIQSASAEVQDKALVALPEFFLQYYCKDSMNLQLFENIIAKYISNIDSADQNARIGYCRALGILPQKMIVEFKDQVLAKLESSCRDTSNVELRRYSIQSLANFITNIQVQNLNSQTVDRIFQFLLLGFDDYTVDSRGDTGCWVREETMSAIKVICDLVIVHDKSSISREISELIFVNLAKQAVEKIDRVRGLAGSVFSYLLFRDANMEYVPQEEALKEIFESDHKIIDWSKPSDTYHRFVQLLKFQEFRYPLLLGLCVSAGGVTESVAKSSGDSLSDHLRSIKDDRDTLKIVSTDLLRVISQNESNSRITIPYFCMMDQLLSNEIITPETVGDEFFTELVKHCKKELQRCADPTKLRASVDLFCTLTQFTVCRSAVLSYLAILLVHRYPRVRLDVATKLYDTFLAYDLLDELSKGDEVLAIMGDTDWNEPVDKLRPIRDNLCDMLNIPKPIKRAKQSS